MNFKKRPGTGQVGPRAAGWNAGHNLNLGIQDNPHDEIPIAADPIIPPPEGETHPPITSTEPGHPHREWREGFIRSRILLQKQNQAIVAFGRSIPLIHRAAPTETIRLLQAVGQKGGEFVAMALLSAALEVAGVDIPVDEPVAVGLLYGAMKDRINHRPRSTCHEPKWEEFHRAAYDLGYFLTGIFQRQRHDILVRCHVPNLQKALANLVEVDDTDNQVIAHGRTEEKEPQGTETLTQAISTHKAPEPT